MVRLRRGRDEGGATAVEFALVAPILIVLLFGIIQWGWYFYAMQSGTSATGDVVRRLSVGACQTSTTRATLLKKDLGSALTGSITTNSVTYTDTAGKTSASAVQGGSVTLKLQFQTFDMHFPFIPVPGGGVVTRTQTARVEDATAVAGTTCS